jgi:hypothetical protein
MASKFDKMQMPPRQMKGKPEPEEIKLEIGMGDEEEPMAEDMEVEMGANLPAMSADEMIDELKKQGILPPDFKKPASERPEEGDEEVAPPQQVSGKY